MTTKEGEEKIVEKNGALRVGIPLSSYPDFKELLVNKLDQKGPVSFLIKSIGNVVLYQKRMNSLTI